MRWKRDTYRIHRWVGLLVSLQLLAWSVSGFLFTVLDIDNVRGDLDRADQSAPVLSARRVAVSPGEAVTAARRDGRLEKSVGAIRLRRRFGRVVYELFDTRRNPMTAVDAVSGAVLRRITEAEARSAALADFASPVEVKSVRWIEDNAPIEFRGGALPVYQVILDHPKSPHLYVSPITGEVLKRRNRPWRLFDFFWMLHIMDYRDREDFNHWLLTGMSLLAVTTSLTGLTLWSFRARRALFVRRMRRQARSTPP